MYKMIFLFVLLAISCLPVSSVWATDKSVSPPAEYLHPCSLKGRDDNPVDAFCGEFKVAENRALGDKSKLITLPIIYIRSQSRTMQPPLFILRGGPGASNLSQRPIPWLFSNRDFVMVGYRGADGETSFNCPNMKKGQLGDGKNLLSETSKKMFSKSVKRCADELNAQGWDLSQYTMIQVIDDIEEVRKSLGLSEINLISESYGTRVAQIYSYMYPNSINRSIMIGINPPGRFIWSAELIDKQIKKISRLCAEDKYCSSRTQNLANTIKKAVHNMPNSWFGITIDPGKVRFLAFNFLFHVEQAAMIYDLFIDAEQGDYAGLALLTLAYDLQIQFGDPQPLGDLFSKGLVDHIEGRDYDAEFDLSRSIFGSPMSELLMSGATSWPIADFPTQYRSPQTSNVSTLLVNGSMDFSTPIENVKTDLLPYLSNAALIELEGMGHVGDIYFEQPEAFSKLVNGFLLDGRVDRSLFKAQNYNFKPSTSLSNLMKWIGAIAVILFLALSTLFYFIICRITKAIKRKRNFANLY